MILSDRDIMDERAKGTLDIDPWTPELVGPASVDLRLDGGMLIKPGEFRLANTLEVVTVPPHLAATLAGRSSVGRQGLQVQNAGFIDPGFSGQIVMELVNQGNQMIHIEYRQAIAQIIFHELRTEAMNPYNGHYQNQRGVEGSYLDK